MVAKGQAPLPAARLQQMRGLTLDCIAKHMHQAATFFASKLCSMSDQHPDDVYLLAQTYFNNKEYRRAHALLNKPELFAINMRYRYLAAMCMASCQEWEACLAIIGTEDIAETLNEKAKSEGTKAQGHRVNMYSSVCLLRGRVYDALENRSCATFWYKSALKSDPFCFEAYSALVDNHMLSNNQELELLNCLDFTSENQWLAVLYLSMGKKYQDVSGVDVRLRLLEGKSWDDMHEQLPLSLEQNDSIRENSARSVSETTTPPAFEDECGAPMTGCPRDLLPLHTLRHDPACSSLANDYTVRIARADYLYRQADTVAAYRHCRSIVQDDPRALECMPVYLACMVQLGKKNELFQLGHQLVQDYAEHGIAWYAVGCYYLSTGQHDAARRFFGKATQLAPRHAPSWIAYGHAYAAQDESDQALAAYRTATRLFPGLHEPLLGMGREYQHMNNHILAEQMFLQASGICKLDPMICNELGVLYFNKRNFAAAVTWLQRARALLSSERITASCQPVLSNLGHALRKLERFVEAAEAYTTALGLVPCDAPTLTALAYTHHLAGDLTEAIETYHSALAYRADCSLSQELLQQALQEHCRHCCHNDDPGLM